MILKKFEPNLNYYFSINFRTSITSPEYISINQTYYLKIRGSSSKYFYCQINKNSTGHIKIRYPSDYATRQNVTIYAKIVKKNEIEKDYNWNKRVKLPEENDENLLFINETLVQFNENDTEKCDNGCELYFNLKNLRNSEAYFNFLFYEGEYKEEPKKEEEKDEPDNNLWLKILIPVLIVVVIAVIVLVVLIMVKKKRNADINKKDIDDISGYLVSDSK